MTDSAFIGSSLSGSATEARDFAAGGGGTGATDGSRDSERSLLLSNRGRGGSGAGSDTSGGSSILDVDAVVTETGPVMDNSSASVGGTLLGREVAEVIVALKLKRSILCRSYSSQAMLTIFLEPFAL